MDYEKKYKKAMAKAKEFQEKGIMRLEEIFPELKESEDEKIRKELIAYCQVNMGYIWHDIKQEDYIAWLEKQGEQKSDKVEPKFHKGDWIIHQGTENIYQIVAVLSNHYQLKYGDNYTIQKCADVDRCARLWGITKDAKYGDVLINWNNTTFIFKAIEDETVKFHIAYNEKWDTIKTPSTELSHLGFPEPHFVFHPATKEQRDALMKAMADAGYEWDAEKKKLKKIVVPIFNIGDTIIKKHNSNIRDFGFFTITDITGGKYWYNDRIICDITEQYEWELYETIKQNPAWSEEDEINLEKAIWYVENPAPMVVKDSMLVDWLKSTKHRVIPQPKQEWSEEDRKHLNDVIREIQANFDADETESTEYYKKLVDWLESLRPQKQWKPSDEQIGMLIRICNNLHVQANKDAFALDKFIDEIRNIWA